MRTPLIASLICLAAAAQATSLASSASQAGSSAASSASDSLQGSSQSSAGDRRAEGRYRVTDVAQAGEGRKRLTLVADAGQPLVLTLPETALADRPLNLGDAVQATPRPYGVEFAHADTRTAFFLVLDDAWHGELRAQPVK